MRIVFFTNPWASAKIRGDQIAARFENAVVNPPDIRIGDVCVFVKCCPDSNVVNVADKCYLDIVDSWALMETAKEHPELGIISIGVTAHNYLREQLQRDDIILIPEHHCNFKNELRDRNRVTRVGFCGYTENFHLSFGEVSQALADIDIEFVSETQIEDRINICSFYKSIDVQLCFRNNDSEASRLKNPLKLANAGSFRIPTISYPEVSYVAEWAGAFARVTDLDQIVRGVKVLRDSEAAYDNLADAALKKSKEYHIDKVIPLYKEILV